MPRGSAERTSARRDEILNACAKIADRMTTEPLSIAEIASATSFGRTSIYNYFRTREEIILALLERQYDAWTADLGKIRSEPQVHDLETFLEALAASLGERRLLLKILNMNLFQVEESCRLEALTSFKAAYGRSLEAVKECLEIYWPDSDEAERTAFVLVFFPFMHGLYPYSTVTDKQAQAMEEAGVVYSVRTVPELALAFLRRYFGLDPALISNESKTWRGEASG